MSLLALPLLALGFCLGLVVYAAVAWLAVAVARTLAAAVLRGYWGQRGRVEARAQERRVARLHPPVRRRAA